VGGRIPKEASMRCVVCKHGETQSGAATVTLSREQLTLVIKDVPAQVCENCGEEYVDAITTARLLHTAEEAAQSGIQVDVRQYIAV
jgi:YgiT-type zinc finger domain-containing protein